jgi:hypothetical protein
MDIGLGILIGIISTAAFAFLAYLFKNVILPIVHSAYYKEANLSGQWYTNVTNPSGNTQDMTMKLRHRGQNIDGKMTVVKHLKKEGISEIKNFLVKGDIQNRFIIFNARNVDKQAIGAATFLLEVIGDARTMKGMGVWYSITNKTVNNAVYEWKKGTVPQANPSDAG